MFAVSVSSYFPPALNQYSAHAQNEKKKYSRANIPCVQFSSLLAFGPLARRRPTEAVRTQLHER